MQAFGRDVASRTVAGVLSGLILAILASVWAGVKYIAPILATRYGLALREAIAWVIAGVAVLSVLSFVALAKKRRPASRPAKPSTVTLSLNNGVKPSVTLTNHGGPTTYRVDGRIVGHVDGTASPQPAPFRCHLQVGGIAAGWDVVLQDGEWANIILGSIEGVLPASSAGLTVTQSWTPVGKMLVIRRGKMGQHVRVPDSGAIVELTIKTTPPLAESIGPRQFRVVRTGDTATVTHA